MKKNLNEQVAESMNVAKTTKGYKSRNAQSASSTEPTRTSAKARIIAYIRSKEDISVSKFFRLLDEFRNSDKKGYNEFCTAYNLDFEKCYNFEWFAANCPKLNGEFAKWVRVDNEKVFASANTEHNRTTAKGVTYTLKPFVTLRANYEQFFALLSFVLSDEKRIKREQAAAEREQKKAAEQARKAAAAKEKALKAAKEIKQEIETLCKEFGFDFDTAAKVYTKTKNIPLTDELTKALKAA